MNIELYNYNLPEHLIAKHPSKTRTSSRMLCLNKNNNSIEHKEFSNLVDYLEPNDLLVLNNSKVIKARIFGKKSTGGKVELLIERIISKTDAIAHIKANKSPKPGDIIFINDFSIEILGKAKGIQHTILSFLTKI